MKEFEPTGLGLEIFKDRYARSKEETWKEACNRVAIHISTAETNGKVEQYRQLFYEELVSNRFMPGGRIMHSAGRTKPQMLNCFVIPGGDDSREGWGTLLYDTTVISGLGGGIGSNFSCNRPNGFDIKGTGGKASGPVSVMKMQNSIGNELRQGGGRKPALMQCLDITHPDIEEFLSVKLDKGQLNNANVSVALNVPTEEFIDLIKNDGDIELEFNGLPTGRKLKAREVWNKIVENAWKSGEPGVLNMWLSNKMSNIYYQEQLTSTNPCLTANMRLHTKQGYKTLWQLWRTAGYQEYSNNPTLKKFGKLEIVNRNGVVSATNVYKTSNSQKIYRVTFSDGSIIDATDYHKFIVIKKGGAEERVFLKDLKKGDVVPSSHLPIFGNNHNPVYALLAGWTIGNGKFTRNSETYKFHAAPIVDMSDLKSIVDFNIKVGDGTSLEEHYNNLGFSLAYDGVLPSRKFVVPESIWSSDEETISAFLKGIFSSRARIKTYKNRASIKLTGFKIGFLRELQILLYQIGVSSSIVNKKELVISGGALLDFYWLVGFVQESLQSVLLNYCDVETESVLNKTIKVKSIEYIGKQPTFCLTEPGNNEITINGKQISQCGEVALSPYDCCCLGSVVLPRFVENGEFNWDALDTTVRVGVRFLDNVLDVNHYPLDKIRDKCSKNRRIGLGVMGLHTMLLDLGLKYASEEGFKFVDKLFNFIKNTAYDCSVTIAAEKGPFPVFNRDKYLQSGFVKTLKPGIRNKIKMHGVRNCAILSIAPTGTISMVAGVSSGLEPLFAPAYYKRYRKIGENGKEYIEKALVITEEYKKHGELAVGAYDIPVRAHFEIQKIVQKHVDNAVSKTVNLPIDYKVDDLREIWLEYLPFIKGATLYRQGSRGEEPLEHIPIDEVKKIINVDSEKASIEDLNSLDCPNGVCKLT